jgi:hypothetical protein
MLRAHCRVLGIALRAHSFVLSMAVVSTLWLLRAHVLSIAVEDTLPRVKHGWYLAGTAKCTIGQNHGSKCYGDI